MRIGKFWHEESIDSTTKNRIEHLISGEECSGIDVRVREKVAKAGLCESIEQYQGLPQWLANYVVYNRHSEASEIIKWESPDELDNYIRSFKQYSLRNPIVEQVSLETLRVVRDLWAELQKKVKRLTKSIWKWGATLKTQPRNGPGFLEETARTKIPIFVSSFCWKSFTQTKKT